MSEVANDILSSTGLPFRDYSSYCARVLFANDKWQCYVKVNVSHFVNRSISGILISCIGK